MLLHCTQKLLKVLGNPPLHPTEESASGLGNWYANIFFLDRKKCLLFTNEKSLYSFIIPSVKKEDLKHIIDAFLLNLSLNLQVEGFPIGVISKIMQEYKDIHFAKTASKKVLGSMNEIAFQAKYIIVNHHGGIENVKVLAVNKDINRAILGAIGYYHPIEKLRELLTGKR
jgi:uncharacterized protein DUF6933